MREINLRNLTETEKRAAQMALFPFGQGIYTDAGNEDMWNSYIKLCNHPRWDLQIRPR